MNGMKLRVVSISTAYLLKLLNVKFEADSYIPLYKLNLCNAKSRRFIINLIEK